MISVFLRDVRKLTPESTRLAALALTDSGDVGKLEFKNGWRDISGSEGLFSGLYEIIRFEVHAPFVGAFRLDS
jgi:hypothetical protein